MMCGQTIFAGNLVGAHSVVQQCANQHSHDAKALRLAPAASSSSQDIVLLAERIIKARQTLTAQGPSQKWKALQPGNEFAMGALSTDLNRNPSGMVDFIPETADFVYTRQILAGGLGLDQ